ncbi:hypothetical protein HaLaN_28099 [Haematococcus lacustris]|uniref:Uncharacterized protein n=1 Tax=Haematococcus lacustris TaxID=44745 RepID=A0A6A0A9T9_HAELA|nr:hypothetical protein HaLaN_28099 [Haematococcus lacustris]
MLTLFEVRMVGRTALRRLLTWSTGSLALCWVTAKVPLLDREKVTHVQLHGCSTKAQRGAPRGVHKLTMFNAGFNAVSGHTFAICPFEAHWCGCRTSHTKPTRQGRQNARGRGRANSPSHWAGGYCPANAAQHPPDDRSYFDKLKRATQKGLARGAASQQDRPNPPSDGHKCSARRATGGTAAGAAPVFCSFSACQMPLPVPIWSSASGTISEGWQHHACASGATRLEDSPLKPLQVMQVEYISMQDCFKLMLPHAIPRAPHAISRSVPTLSHSSAGLAARPTLKRGMM